PEDQVIRDLGLEAAALAGPLLDLEMEGKVQRHAGGLLSRIA
ncbi:MAG: DNA-protecting protein DprA, partial [Paracoccaceae bacterium]|nr:DNA-protecting protein DprA [Paracoccaceae bacterium]